MLKLAASCASGMSNVFEPQYVNGFFAGHITAMTTAPKSLIVWKAIASDSVSQTCDLCLLVMLCYKIYTFMLLKICTWQ